MRGSRWVFGVGVLALLSAENPIYKSRPNAAPLVVSGKKAVPQNPNRDSVNPTGDMPLDSISASEYKPKEAPPLASSLTQGSKEELILQSKDLLMEGDLARVDPVHPKKVAMVPHKFTVGMLISTLWDALAYAYLQNTDLESARAEVKRLLEALAQAIAENRPYIGVAADGRVHRDRSTAHSRNAFPSTGPTSINESLEHKNTGNLFLTLEQNIFRGGGTQARIQKAEQDYKSALAWLASQEQEVFKRVVDAYINAVVAEEMVVMAQKSESYLSTVFAQSKFGHSIGNTKGLDLSMAQSKLVGATIRVTRAISELANARAQLTALVGADLAPHLRMPEPDATAPNNLKELEKVALQFHPDVLSALFSEYAARHNVDSVAADFWPTLDFTASAGPRYDNGSSQIQNGSMDTLQNSSYNHTSSTRHEVSAGLVMKIPLYNKGLTASRYRDSQQNIKKYRLALEGARRTVKGLCVSYFAAFQASQKNVTSSRIWLETSKDALRAVGFENLLGEQDLLGVLQVADEWVQAYQNYITVMGEFIKNSYFLLILSGNLTAKSLKVNVKLHDPMKYYTENRDRWFGLGEDGEGDALFSLKEGLDQGTGDKAASSAENPVKGGKALPKTLRPSSSQKGKPLPMRVISPIVPKGKQS